MKGKIEAGDVLVVRRTGRGVFYLNGSQETDTIGLVVALGDGTYETTISTSGHIICQSDRSEERIEVIHNLGRL